MTEGPEGGKGRAERPLAPAARPWVAIGTAIVALVSLAAALLFQHFRERTVELAAHYARLAAHTATEVELKYRNFRQVVENVAQSASRVKGMLDESGAAPAKASAIPNVLPSYVPEFEPCKGGPQSLCIARRVADIARTDPADKRKLTFVDCVKLGSTLPVFDANGGYFLLPPPASAGALKVCGKVAMAELFAKREPTLSIVDPRQVGADFDLVVLAGSDGAVMHSYGLDPTLAIRTLPKAARDKSGASSMVPNVDLGSMQYRVFVQPTNLHFAGPIGRIVLAGFVREDRIDREALRFSPARYVWAVLLLGFGILSLPLAKLWLLGPAGSYRRFDVMLLVTSAVVTTLLSVALFFTFSVHSRLERRLDDGLTHVADRLSERLGQHVEGSKAVLDVWSKKARALQDVIAHDLDAQQGAFNGACLAVGGKSTTSEFDDGQAWPVCEVTRALEPRVVMPSGATPPLNVPWKLFFVLNDRGYQQLKIVPGDHATNPISLADRSYFIAAKNRADACTGTAGTTSRCYFPDVVRSGTSGEIVLVVSHPSAYQGGGDRTGLGPVVEAVEMRLEDLRNPVLPIGVQYAVIDASGKVMLHSDNDAHHGQNIFDDLAQTEELRAHMVAGLHGTFGLRYFGASSRVHVRPLQGTNWFVLAVAPDKVVELPTANVLLITLIEYALFWVMAVVGVGLLQLFRDKPINLTPNARYARAYTQAGLFMLGLAAATSVVVLFLTALPMLFPFVTALLLAVAAAWRVPGIGNPETQSSTDAQSTQRGSWTDRLLRPLMNLAGRFSRDAGSRHVSHRDDLSFGYAACCAGLAAMFVVLPVIVFFRAAYEHTVEELVRSEQFHYVRALRFREGCLSGFADESKVCPGVFPLEVAPPRTAQSPRQLAGILPSSMALLMDLLPALEFAPNQECGRMYKAGAIEWKWARDGDDLHLLSLQDQPILRTPLPRLTTTAHQWTEVVLLILLMIALIAVASVATFHSARRLRFLGLLRELARRTPKTTPDSLLASKGKTFVLFPDDDLTANLCQDERFQSLPKYPSSGPERGHVWFLADIRDRLDEAKLLDRLEQVPDEQPLVILCGVDPLRRAPAALRHRWAALLASCTVIEELRKDPDIRATSDAPPRAAFAKLWDSCDDDEKRVLAQIATDGHASPHPANIGTMRHLARRGLLDVDTLDAKPKFRRFIADEAVSAEDRQRWARADTGSVWQALRIPLTIGVGLLLAVLGSSKPELAAVGAAIPTVAASLPVILRVLASIASSKSS